MIHSATTYKHSPASPADLPSFPSHAYKPYLHPALVPADTHCYSNISIDGQIQFLKPTCLSRLAQISLCACRTGKLRVQRR
jgi:hypothetical protein